MAVTPNYSWPVPVNTDYVKDGAEALKDLGDAIDATVFGLPSGALALVKTQVIGTAVTSVNVTSAFSATYPAYKIFISGGVCSASSTLAVKLGNSTTQYYVAGLFIDFTGSTNAATTNNGASFLNIGRGDGTILNLQFELIDPNNASYTKIFGSRNANDANTVYGGIHEVSTAYTDFTITVSTGTMTGGTIYVYGYAGS